VPTNSEGVVRPKGQAPPIDIDDLLYQAMGDPAILTPELAATIEQVSFSALSCPESWASWPHWEPCRAGRVARA
jgi:hypothetical protein